MKCLPRAVARARVGRLHGIRLVASAVVCSVFLLPGGALAAPWAGTGSGQEATIAGGSVLGDNWIALRPPASPVRVGKVVVFQVAVRFPHTTQLAVAAYVLGLQGTWEDPWLVTPGNSEACGGDNSASLRPRSPHRWSPNFGDCRQLGVATWATRAGVHRVSVEVYRIPVGRGGRLLTGRATKMRWASVHLVGARARAKDRRF